MFDVTPAQQRLIVLFLSLIPGLAHLYLGQIKKAIVMLLISLSLILTFIFAKSLVMKTLMSLVYLGTLGPAGIEAQEIVRFGISHLTERKWYVTFLLLVTGFSALPLLWQSVFFTKRAKIAWSIAVPVLAVIFFTTLGRYWTDLEHYLERIIHGKTY